MLLRSPFHDVGRNGEDGTMAEFRTSRRGAGHIPLIILRTEIKLFLTMNLASNIVLITNEDVSRDFQDSGGIRMRPSSVTKRDSQEL
ncbi:hypothetical protein TNCV_4575391 [Trichonephila clavipes]|nr:hypothetical protein TNCV_4575391 [Trichonephila clavipes]